MTSDVAARATPVSSPEPAGSGGATAPDRWRSVLRWESGLVLVLVAVLLFGKFESTTFFTTTTLFYAGLNVGYIAIMALPVTFVIMTGEIDLSVASMLGLSGAVIGELWHHGWPIWAVFVVALLTGAVGGALNGFLVARVGLPSIAVTIGTLALYRGVAEILLGSSVIPGAGDRPFPTGLTKLGAAPVSGTQLSWSTIVFLILAVVFGVVLHMTALGRSLYAIGLQPEAARFAGIRVNRVKFWLFVVSGFLAAFAGILFAMQNASVSYNAGSGLELNVVAIVLFGGISIFGGRGSIPGVVLSVLIIASLQIALTQMRVSPEVQNIVTGALLLISVLVPNSGEVYRRARLRLRRAPAR